VVNPEPLPRGLEGEFVVKEDWGRGLDAATVTGMVDEVKVSPTEDSGTVIMIRIS
jgi:hypothetical protein